MRECAVQAAWCWFCWCAQQRRTFSIKLCWHTVALANCHRSVESKGCKQAFSTFDRRIQLAQPIHSTLVGGSGCQRRCYVHIAIACCWEALFEAPMYS